ncbi:hypothetical protein Hdeb2414_s0008g00282871 [Helianthus debilis subsp. tardiflorus]
MDLNKLFIHFAYTGHTLFNYVWRLSDRGGAWVGFSQVLQCKGPESDEENSNTKWYPDQKPDEKLRTPFVAASNMRQHKLLGVAFFETSVN